MRVFIADDSAVIRERLVAMLSEIEGLEVAGETKDGLEAHKAILEQKPDVVILDLRMPWRNGLDVLCDIKESSPDIKVIILTNYPYPQYRRRIRTTNGLERFNQEIKQRTRVIRIFPNRNAALRLIGALCMEQAEEWLTNGQCRTWSFLRLPFRAFPAAV